MYIYNSFSLSVRTFFLCVYIYSYSSHPSLYVFFSFLSVSTFRRSSCLALSDSILPPTRHESTSSLSMRCQAFSSSLFVCCHAFALFLRSPYSCVRYQDLSCGGSIFSLCLLVMVTLAILLLFGRCLLHRFTYAYLFCFQITRCCLLLFVYL